MHGTKVYFLALIVALDAQESKKKKVWQRTSFVCQALVVLQSSQYSNYAFIQ